MDYSYLKHIRKIICIGRNYAAHIKELNNPTPKQPFFFLKPSSSILTPPVNVESIDNIGPENCTYSGLKSDGSNSGKILIPRGVKVHHEVELALVMSQNVSNASKDAFGPKELYDSISGVALSLDLTARNVQDEAKKKGLPWSIGKGFDTFLPISGFIPKRDLGDPASFQNAFRLKCEVNGVTRQDGTTDLMLTPMHEIVQHISTVMSLESGDLVLTGTPAGVGELHANDTVTSYLYHGDKLLTKMTFACAEKPGPYEFKET
ncbi:LAME_0G20164g1_1 [Lachancea meyersii CBS 8951]|uniref:oxaloacetate tautomerase n=1 Tax=Lachancea meyersii CBS 8951 TaxID=1266667 RepID=A0A1G4KCE5_9SACH|nr:LAME_0G20164g1_1 [Lachancea meyersii CBS 8951]